MHCGSARQPRNAAPCWDGQVRCPSRLPEEHVHHPRLADSHRMVYRQRANRYVGGIGPPDGEGRPVVRQRRQHPGQTGRASPRSLPWSPFVRPRTPILGRIEPRDRGPKPSLTYGDAVQPPIGSEPRPLFITRELHTRKHSTGRICRVNQGNLARSARPDRGHVCPKCAHANAARRPDVCRAGRVRHHLRRRHASGRGPITIEMPLTPLVVGHSRRTDNQSTVALRTTHVGSTRLR
jgi:hypothetical protein